MSVTTRALSVLVLASFLGFLFVRIAQTAYREPFRDYLSLEKADHKFQVARLDEKIDANESLRRNLVRDNQRIRFENEDLDHEIGKLRQKEIDLAEEIEFREREIERLKVDLVQFEAILNQEIEANNRLEALNIALRQQIGEVRYLKVQAETMAIRYSEEKTKLEREITEHRRQLAAAERELKGVLLILAWLDELSVPVPGSTGSIVARVVDARILAADSKTGVYILNKGKRKGVEGGMEFVVYRDDHYVGKIIVEEVLPDYSSAREVEGLQRAEIRAGDKATTAPYAGRED